MFGGCWGFVLTWPKKVFKNENGLATVEIYEVRTGNRPALKTAKNACKIHKPEHKVETILLKIGILYKYHKSKSITDKFQIGHFFFNAKT